jgi:hypothetical protein
MTQAKAAAAAEHRDQVIRAIHAFADWLAAHPDVPVPERINSTHHNIVESGEGRWGLLPEFAAVYHLEINHSDNFSWANLPVIAMEAQGVEITHTVFDYVPAFPMRLP